MRVRILWGLVFLTSLMFVITAAAQEGHPLKGSWIGDWGPNKGDRNPVTIVLDWDGKNITGTINPGPNAVPIQKATLEPKGWLVHFEAETKDRSGKIIRYVIDGKIDNLGLPNRAIVGTWTHDNVKGDFTIQRQ